MGNLTFIIILLNFVIYPTHTMKYCLFALLGLTSAQDGNEGI